MPSVTRAFSVFWEMEAVICSIEEVVSSTEAACSLDDCDNDWAVAETWPAALVRLSAAVRTSPMICVRLLTVRAIASCSSPISSCRVTVTVSRRSPSARWSAVRATAWTSRSMRASNIPKTIAVIDTISDSSNEMISPLRAVLRSSVALATVAVAMWSSRPFIASILRVMVVNHVPGATPKAPLAALSSAMPRISVVSRTAGEASKSFSAATSAGSAMLRKLAR